MDKLNLEALLRIVAENTGKRISLSLDDIDQYLSVARAAIAADRAARQGEPVGFAEVGHLELLAQRAKVGAYIKVYAVPFRPESNRPTVPVYRAATKAAAPAGAPTWRSNNLLPKLPPPPEVYWTIREDALPKGGYRLHFPGWTNEQYAIGQGGVLQRIPPAGEQDVRAVVPEGCAHCNRLPGERRDECEHCPAGAAPAHPGEGGSDAD